MQDRVQLTQNGQELQQADVNLIAKEAALADDRVLAEFLRLAPYAGGSYAKAILPYFATGTGNTPTVQAGTGGVTVNPFRAIVGSRTVAGTSAPDNWQDTRSAVFVGSSTSLTLAQALSANASGNPRWDLVYAAVTVDGNGATNTRYIKNPSTKVVTATSTVTTLTTPVVIGVVTGTPGASPAFPALPSDSGGIYYIPLAYVRVVNGFTGATVLNARDINEVLPPAALAPSSGMSTLRPANQMNVQGGTAISGAGTSAMTGTDGLAWTGTSNKRPNLYLPPSMQGQQSILIAFDFLDASSANWSHQNNAIVDSSVDWRYRVFKWMTMITANAVNTWAWSHTISSQPMPSGTNQVISAPNVDSGASHLAYQHGFGQGFYPDFNANQAGVFKLQAAGNVPTTVMAATSLVSLYVDLTTGNLKVNITNSPAASIFIWLDASAQFSGW